MTDRSFTTQDVDFQHLLSKGFSETEAKMLIHMRENVSEQIEYRELQEESRRLNFLRWLIEHDRMSR